MDGSGLLVLLLIAFVVYVLIRFSTLGAEVAELKMKVGTLSARGYYKPPKPAVVRGRGAQDRLPAGSALAASGHADAAAFWLGNDRAIARSRRRVGQACLSKRRPTERVIYWNRWPGGSA